ncbi:hypothetical protein J5X84_15305 [Streptosporangiaceae bacterium NEAU-GS5]|nr:hypothetical protein [Streptosporangiaceae bacterium NEAU-GS5]
MPTTEEITAAQDSLRDLFFALAFDPDGVEAAAQADAALDALDELLAADAS